MMPNRSLSQILDDSNRTLLQQAWDATKAAAELQALPSGEYIAHITGGELDTSRNGTLGYKLSFTIIEGEHVGRRLWHDIWLTAPALPMAKRDLAKLGVTNLEQLEQPLPQGIRVKARVVLRRDDAGCQYNRVKGFEVLGIDRPERDAFAPDDAPKASAADAIAQPNGQEGGDHDLPI